MSDCSDNCKQVNRGAFWSTMAKIWQTEGRIVFREVGWNRFLIEFQGEKEKNRIMQGQLWSFDKFLMCLRL